MSDAITGAVRDKLVHLIDSYVALEEAKVNILEQQKDIKGEVKDLNVQPKVFAAAVKWKLMSEEERQKVTEYEEEIDLVRRIVD